MAVSTLAAHSSSCFSGLQSGGWVVWLVFLGASQKTNEKLRGNDGGVCVRGGLAKWLQLIAGTLCPHCVLSHTDLTSDSLPVS